jgi:hypothetical protein
VYSGKKASVTTETKLWGSLLFAQLVEPFQVKFIFVLVEEVTHHLAGECDTQALSASIL